jgi:DNA-binding beta-propeller fold protein YncE
VHAGSFSEVFMTRISRTSIVLAAGAVLLGTTLPASAAGTAFLNTLTTVRTVASTVPGNGDINPYGVAVVPHSTGHLHRGWVLVSNFNEASNLQGTGRTIMQISPAGKASLFARVDPAHLPGPCPGGVGLTTALSVLSSGWVVVGSLPTTDGTAATAKAGCLLVLDSHGRVRETIADRAINGPWDMTASEHGNAADLFVTNVLNGTVAAHGAVVNRGTVVRIRLRLPDEGDALPVASRPVVIGSGFAEHTDPAALVVGPTGLTLSRRENTLYVADTASNRISAIRDASRRTRTAFSGVVITSGGHLNGPLGLSLAPNGDVLSVNAADGLIVETTPAGAQVARMTLDATGTPPGSGTLFGLAVSPDRKGVYFVDDGTNTLKILH